MTESAIVSIAITDWIDAGKPTPSPMDRLADVAIRALRNAEMGPKDLDAIITNTTALPFNEASYITISAQHFAHRLAEKIGTHGMRCMNVCAACASAAISFATADAMIKAGILKTVLVGGVDNSPRGFYFQGPSMLDTDLAVSYPHKVVGITNPSYWAMWARRRAYEMGKSVEDIKELMALVKEMQSGYGALNPYARYKKTFTVKEVLDSPIVCDPLHLYMISAVSSGAGAAIVTDVETAKKITDKPVKIAASAVGSVVYGEPSPRLVYFATAGGKKAKKPFIEWRKPIEAAYKQAGITAEDVDILECHDTSCFHTINWIDQVKGWEREETDKLIRNGQTRHSGEFPVNLSGGTSSFGEAVMSQALVMIHDLLLQLRGEAGERQAKKRLRTGMCTAYGAYGSYGVIILEKGW
jgi:acetyl-CoA acetyltransferase